MPEADALAHKREISRQSRARNPEGVRSYLARYRAANPEKVRAKNRVQRAVRSGRLERGPCRICGEANSEGHHSDYSKPLDVVWLCRKHHKDLHYGRLSIEGVTSCPQ
jgi:hypothetical protein